MNDQAVDYFEFNPKTLGSIAVTLGTVGWTFGFEANYNSGSWTVNPALSNGNYQDSVAFPLWTGRLQGQGHN